MEVAGGEAAGRFAWRGAVGSPLLSRGSHRRVFFIVVDEEIILLHGIIKKTRTAPKQDLDLARKRQAAYMKEETKHEKESTPKRPPRK